MRDVLPIDTAQYGVSPNEIKPYLRRYQTKFAGEILSVNANGTAVIRHPDDDPTIERPPYPVRGGSVTVGEQAWCIIDTMGGLILGKGVDYTTLDALYGTSPSCKLVQTTATNVPFNVDTTVAFQSVQYDSNNFRSGNSIVIPAGLAGKYLVVAIINFDGYATTGEFANAGIRRTWVKGTGAPGPALYNILNAASTSGAPTYCAYVDVFSLIAGATLNITAYHSHSALTIPTIANSTSLAVVRLSL